jgi:hypothetical protein
MAQKTDKSDLIATMQSDIKALQARLKAAGLDDSLPSSSVPQVKSEGAAATEETEKPAQSQSGAAASVDFLEDAPRSAEELAKVKAAADAIDMEEVGKIKAEGNEYFRISDFKNACTSYMKAIRMLDAGWFISLPPLALYFVVYYL